MPQASVVGSVRLHSVCHHSLSARTLPLFGTVCTVVQNTEAPMLDCFARSKESGKMSAWAGRGSRWMRIWTVESAPPRLMVKDAGRRSFSRLSPFPCALCLAAFLSGRLEFALPGPCPFFSLALDSLPVCMHFMVLFSVREGILVPFASPVFHLIGPEQCLRFAGLRILFRFEFEERSASFLSFLFIASRERPCLGESSHSASASSSRELHRFCVRHCAS